MFQSLKSKVKINEKKFMYFTYKYKKISNLGKLYLFLKTGKRLHEMPGRPLISNCGISREKISEFLDSQLKTIMQKSLP